MGEKNKRSIEANDFVEELDGVKCLPSSSMEESNDRVRPERLEFNESSLSRNESYPPEAIMSPMTPGIDENDEILTAVTCPKPTNGTLKKIHKCCPKGQVIADSVIEN